MTPVLTKPSILIPLQQVINAHQLLLEYEEAVAPTISDPLHDILEDLGEAATLEDLLGVQMIESAVDLEEAKKTEILLTVSSKKSFNDKAKKSLAQSLYIHAKHMITT